MRETDKVDAWMAAYDNPQKALVQAVREAILEADERVGETIKWQAPTFTYKGNIASFFPRRPMPASCSIVAHISPARFRTSKAMPRTAAR